MNWDIYSTLSTEKEKTYVVSNVLKWYDFIMPEDIFNDFTTFITTLKPTTYFNIFLYVDGITHVNNYWNNMKLGLTTEDLFELLELIKGDAYENGNKRPS